MDLKGGKETSELLGVHQRTLYQWDKKGLIETVRTPGGKRLYNVTKFLKDRKIETEQPDIIDEQLLAEPKVLEGKASLFL
jgi:excisionase family DNA binding protein